MSPATNSKQNLVARQCSYLGCVGFTESLLVFVSSYRIESSLSLWNVRPVLNPSSDRHSRAGEPKYFLQDLLTNRFFRFDDYSQKFRFFSAPRRFVDDDSLECAGHAAGTFLPSWHLLYFLGVICYLRSCKGVFYALDLVP